MTPVNAELTIEMLPARQGDALLVGWGPPVARHRMLVDGGPATAYRTIAPLLAERVGDQPLDLLVLTHIDGDHIEGTILLTNDADLGLDIREVWYNGSGMLVSELGAVQGEILEAIITARKLPWNIQTGGKAVHAPVSGTLPVLPQPDDLQLTVLGPDPPTMTMLRDTWLQACADAQLTFGSVEQALAVLAGRSNLKPSRGYLSRPPVPDVRALARGARSKDTKIPNRSSIVLLLEYGDVRVLLAGDATVNALLPAVRRLLAERGVDRLPLTAFKLPHHGSARNLSRELLDLLPAQHYLFSSDGTQFGHPDDEGVAAVLEFGRPGAELVFNYRNPRTLKWDDERLAEAGYEFSTCYPDRDPGGVELRLPSGTRSSHG